MSPTSSPDFSGDSSPDIGRAAMMGLLAIALVYGGFYTARAILGSGQGVDFGQYYTPSRLILDGSPLIMYDTGALYQAKALEFGVRRIPSDKGEL
ncbi:MAG: hypothetical protein ABIK44_05950, partial [candidate division WOR-3 bacterium]